MNVNNGSPISWFCLSISISSFPHCYLDILDKQSLIKTVNALVFSRMYYCSSVWCNTSKKNFAKLQTLQNCAPRIVTKIKKYDHITPALKQLDWLPVDQMLRLREATMVFKCLKGLAPSYLSDKIYQKIRHPQPKP